jgi:hypothetical protein
MLEHDSKLKEQDRIVSYIIRITSAFVLHTPLASIYIRRWSSQVTVFAETDRSLD